MKSLLILSALFIVNFSATGQVKNPNYDSTLAGRLGADEYGMKMYVMVILRTGSNKVQDKVVRDSLFAGHQRNIRRLVGLKKLIVAGPIAENERSYRGIFIFDVKTIEEAKELIGPDPTVEQKIFEPEFYKWYGSAALPEYLEASDLIWKIRP